MPLIGGLMPTSDDGATPATELPTAAWIVTPVELLLLGFALDAPQAESGVVIHDGQLASGDGDPRLRCQVRGDLRLCDGRLLPGAELVIGTQLLIDTQP